MRGAELREAELGTVIMMAMSAAVERDIFTQCSLRTEIGTSLVNMTFFLLQQVAAVEVWMLPCQVGIVKLNFINPVLTSGTLTGSPWSAHFDYDQIDSTGLE